MLGGAVTLDEATGLPGLELQALTTLLLSFLLATLRIGAFMISAPLFGSQSVPLQVRIVASICIGLAVYGQVPIPDVEALPFLGLIRAVLVELTIGLAAGLVLSILFGAVALAGEKIAASGGLGFAAQVDPNSGGQTPVVSQFLSLFLVTVFLSLDGHLRVLAGLIRSYEILPIGAPFAIEGMVRGGLGAAGDMFAIASSIMLPVVAILLLINVTVGVVTRAAPQLNLFSFGFPLTLIAVFLALYLTATPMGYAMADLVEYAVQAMERLLSDMRNG